MQMTCKCNTVMDLLTIEYGYTQEGIISSHHFCKNCGRIYYYRKDHENKEESGWIEHEGIKKQ